MERARILILTASIGSGHLRAAEAIRAALAAHPQAGMIQVDVVDFMAREVSAVHYLMKRIYLMMLRFVPDLYDVFFRIAGKRAGRIHFPRGRRLFGVRGMVHPIRLRRS